ncbi:uncharacterized protein LOC129230015 [Uloborus diversus]|uniref:uncharacterized protein LOC129230015 n=1 Tax=Uloborus diversus TaxID=327109 RepID=UPI00240A0FA9|nr:uncharacterized protein LOC129230015 [Uloborus diversus]
MAETKRVSKEQLCIMLDWMEDNNKLFTNQLTNDFTNQDKKKMWTALTATLNAQGGCKKSTDKWMRAWIDWKSSVKKKAAEIIKENNKTGGGSPSGKQLSELEARCAALLGRTAITGMEEIPSTASDEEISAETLRRPLQEISCSKRPLMENDSGSSSKKKRNEVPLQEIVDLQE